MFLIVESLRWLASQLHSLIAYIVLFQVQIVPNKSLDMIVAKEDTALLKNEISLVNLPSCFSCICKKHQQSCFHSKQVLLILFWQFSVFMASTMLTYSLLSLPMVASDFILIWDILQLIVYMFYPVLGYLGERFLRYKLLMIGIFLSSVSCFINMVLTTMILMARSGSDLQFYLCISYIIVSFPGMCGFGILISNIFQFAVSQIQFAPSADLAAYARWGACSIVIGTALPILLIVLCTSSYISSIWLLLPQLVCLSMMIIATLIVVLTRHQLIIEYAPYSDPVKLILQVLRYSWKHKYLLRRSAFAYDDGYVSRIDLGKCRYGGPFTTEQVESVKCFLRIVIIPLCHVLIPLYCARTLGKYYIRNLENPDFLQNLLLNFPSAVECFVAGICIALFQSIIVPYFPRCVVSIRKRILIGIVFYCLAAASTTVIRFNIDHSQIKVNYTENFNTEDEDEVWSYHLNVVPILLLGFGLFFNLASQLELLFAQVPYSMLGILIGIVHFELGVPVLTDFIGEFTQAANHWEYFLVITVFGMISLIVCSLAVYFYKHQQGNEPSDINVRSKIEEIFNKELNKENRSSSP